MSGRQSKVPAGPSDETNPAASEESPKLRSKSVHLRLTPMEWIVLGLIGQAHGGLGRAEMARRLMVLGVPSPIPEVNEELFGVTSRIESVLYEMRELIAQPGAPVIPELEPGGALDQLLLRLRALILGVA